MAFEENKRYIVRLVDAEPKVVQVGSDERTIIALTFESPEHGMIRHTCWMSGGSAKQMEFSRKSLASAGGGEWGTPAWKCPGPEVEVETQLSQKGYIEAKYVNAKGSAVIVPKQEVSQEILAAVQCGMTPDAARKFVQARRERLKAQAPSPAAPGPTTPLNKAQESDTYEAGEEIPF